MCEEGFLHATGEHRDSLDLTALRDDPAWSADFEIGDAKRRCHVVEPAERPGYQTLQRLGLQRGPNSHRLRQRHGGCERTHPARMRQHREECCPRRASPPRAREAPLHLRADLLDETVVLHAGWAGIDTRHAAQTRVPVAHHLRGHPDLATGREIHEQDATARGIHLLAPEQIGRTGGQAETAVDAVGDQRRVRGVMVVEGHCRCVAAWMSLDARRSGAHRTHVRCHPPGVRGSASVTGRAAA